MQLIRVTYSGKPGRYYVNGRRVTRDSYWESVDAAEFNGARLNSFQTRTSYDSAGNATARHYSCL